ncbi:MAG: ATP-binding cassette domain-containing protein [Gammaproteobacteria bacterium]|nr:ATP-binding cassette domain-containing protein [Gammaproteobacteria bacterium]MDE0252981.1 ATP-binding cassette domain-containing protein [Gammaproteobacteria bacterium]MDE0403663.1 ATP-binding cassette domain-containing protein [Gammaproteobacteria bacterium]
MDPSSNVIFENAYKVFGELCALNNFSLSIPSGCIYGFIGPNGAGKTTAMRILVGITEPTSGEVQVLGSTDIRQIRHQIGYLPEEKGLYKRMRVLDYVVYLGRLNGMSKPTATSRAKELLDKFDLSQWQRARCQELSKGMGQKVQLIATLVHDPILLVLDEPFSGLDPVNVELVRDIIFDRVKQNATVILSTHIMEQAETLCDQIVLINKGETIVEGPIDDIRKGNTIKIEHSGECDVFHGIEHVISTKQVGRTATLQVSENADTQEILAQVLPRTRVSLFNTNAVSLHEIFLRAVGGDERK